MSITSSLCLRLLVSALSALTATAALIPVSVTTVGCPPITTGNGISGDPIFADGSRSLFFLSGAANLVPQDENGSHLGVFRRDLTLGVTTLVSATMAGGPIQGDVLDFTVSADGRWLAFSTAASNAVPGDLNGKSDVFVRDLTSGLTRLVSVSRDGTGAGNAGSETAVISADGRFIAFESFASNLVSEPDNNWTTDIFLRDLSANQTQIISRAPGGGAGNGPSYAPVLSADGSVLVFNSTATELAALQGFGTSLMVWRRASGTVTQVVLPGIPTEARLSPVEPDEIVLSGDGRYLAFSILPYDSGVTSVAGVWWLDLQSNLLIRVSSAEPILGIGGGDLGPSMSADGRTLAFTLMTGAEPNNVPRVHWWNADAGLKALDELSPGVPSEQREPPSSLAPVLSPGGESLVYETDASVPGAGVNESGVLRVYHRVLTTGVTRLVSEDATYPAVVFSEDGQWLTYQTQDPVDPAGDENQEMDVVVWNSTDGSRQVASVALSCAAIRTAGASSTMGENLSDDGRFIPFLSLADNLVNHDTNGKQDAFVFDRLTGSNVLVSINMAGTSAASGAEFVTISGDGHHALFISSSDDLAEGCTNGRPNVFVRDLTAGITILASARDGARLPGNGPASDPQITHDGRWVAFRSDSSDLPRVTPGLNIYLRDLLESRTYLVTDRQAGTLSLSRISRAFFLSADGGTLVFDQGTGGIFVYRHQDRQLLRIPDTNSDGATLDRVAASPDGEIVAYHIANGDSAGLYVQSTRGDSPRRLAGPPSLGAVDLQVSEDGSVLVYSRRVDPAASVSPWQVWALSAETGVEQLISVNMNGLPGMDDSRAPQISADGRFVVFRSFADDLAPGDSNQTEDVFVRDLFTGTTTLVSRTDDGRSADSASQKPRISADGRFVAFTTYASNLLLNDLNGRSDVAVGDVTQSVPTDSDSDGLPDAWELRYFGNLAAGGSDDPDGDGQTNAGEFAAHTSPVSAAARFALSSATAASGGVELNWPGHAGVTYQIETREALAPGGAWNPVGEAVPGYEGTIHGSVAIPAGAAFYRVAVVGR